MIKCIIELISAAKAGGHSGKGHKATRRGEYEKALQHYKVAVEYEAKTTAGPNPVSIECIARTQARLGNFKEALLAAEKSHDLFKQLNPNTNIVADSTARVERFIDLLKAGNTDEINKFLAI